MQQTQLVFANYRTIKVIRKDTHSPSFLCSFVLICVFRYIVIEHVYVLGAIDTKVKTMWIRLSRGLPSNVGETCVLISTREGGR